MLEDKRSTGIISQHRTLNQLAYGQKFLKGCDVSRMLRTFHNMTSYISYIYAYRESMAGSVIQATGTVKFEDGLWIGNHLKARNGLQRVRIIPGVQPGAVRTPGFIRGQTEFQSAWVRVAAWCWARRRVRFLVAVVLGLTWPREVGTFVLFPDVRQNP